MSSISVLFLRLRLARHIGTNLLLGNCGGVLLPGDEVAPSRGAGALPEYKNIAAGGRCERDGDHDDVIFADSRCISKTILSWFTVSKAWAWSTKTASVRCCGALQCMAALRCSNWSREELLG
ncbi:hypothetical protein TcCL_Unassigned02367, partial [Trypanosoma cruzi]